MSVSPSDPVAHIRNTLTRFADECSVPDNAPRSVQRTTEFIHEHLFDPNLTIQHLRDRFGLTDPMFFSRFRAQHGCTPARYVRRLPVEAAKRVLRRHEGIRISDVAFHIGYEHYRTFARLFKRVTGYSPRTFRRNTNHN